MPTIYARNKEGQLKKISIYHRGPSGKGTASVDMTNIPEVTNLDRPTDSSPTAVRYNGEIYLKVEE